MFTKCRMIFAAVAGAVIFVGCGSSPPKCSDEATLALVRDIVYDQLGGASGLTQKEKADNLKFEFPRAVSFDEKVKIYECEAKLVAGEYQVPIKYQTQLGDKGEHLVSAQRILVGDLRMVLAYIQESLTKSRAASSPVAAKADSPPEARPPEQVAAVPASPVQVAASAPIVAVEKAQPTPVVSQTFVPSFDCTKAGTATEKSICSEPILGKLDGALAQNYRFMLASNIGDGAKDDLKQKQKKWMSDRNQCKTNECISAIYRSRIDEVCEYPVLSGLHPACVSASDVK